MAAGPQVVGDLLRRGDREAVDDPRPGCSARWSASQPRRCSGVGRRSTASRSDSRSREPRSAPGPAPSLPRRGRRAELLGDVGADPGVGGGGRGEHRDAVGQVGQQGADPAVVGPEVVAPVGDAVGLVDHEQPAGRGQPRQHLVAEAGVVEPLGADQQHVDLAGRRRPCWIGSHSLELVELIVTARMPARSAAAIWLRIRASSGEMITVGPAPSARSSSGGDEVDRRLTPAGALHHQRAAPVDGQGLKQNTQIWHETAGPRA